MKYLWIAGIALFAVAALAVWFSFSDPRFIAGLVAVVVSSVWAALMPRLLKPGKFTPEEKAKIKSGQSPFSNDR